jgi:hypothetical protein
VSDDEYRGLGRGLRKFLGREPGSPDEFVVFRCRECGYVSTSLGWLHAHIEGHRGYTRFNIQVPFTKTSPANVEELMEYTQVLRVTAVDELAVEAIDGGDVGPEQGYVGDDVLETVLWRGEP